MRLRTVLCALSGLFFPLFSAAAPAADSPASGAWMHSLQVKFTSLRSLDSPLPSLLIHEKVAPAFGLFAANRREDVDYYPDDLRLYNCVFEDSTRLTQLVNTLVEEFGRESDPGDAIVSVAVGFNEPWQHRTPVAAATVPSSWQPWWGEQRYVREVLLDHAGWQKVAPAIMALYADDAQLELVRAFVEGSGGIPNHRQLGIAPSGLRVSKKVLSTLAPASAAR